MLLYAFLIYPAFVYITEKAYGPALVYAVLFWCLVRALFVMVLALDGVRLVLALLVSGLP